MPKHWKAAALVVAALAVLLAVYFLVSDHDSDVFAAKYRLIREGTTEEKAGELFGPAYEQLSETTGFGHKSSTWKHPYDGRQVQAIWDPGGRLRAKSLVGENGTVILSEYFDYDRPAPAPWWERVFKSVGLR